MFCEIFFINKLDLFYKTTLDSWGKKCYIINMPPFCNSFGEVAQHAGHKVLMEVNLYFTNFTNHW